MSVNALVDEIIRSIMHAAIWRTVWFIPSPSYSVGLAVAAVIVLWLWFRRRA